MTDQSCHPVVMEALATHRNQFFRWDKNKLMIELKSKANASNFFMIFMIFGKSREFFWCCKYHAQTFVGVTICNHALKLKGHFFILTIAVICVKVFEYFFSYSLWKWGASFLLGWTKDFSFNGLYVPISVQRKSCLIAPGLVDFAIGLVNPSLFLTCLKGKWSFLGNSNYRRTVINASHQIFFWASTY